jgi:RecA/RadA recombinase
MEASRPPHDPALGFHPNYEAKRADDERLTKNLELLRGIEDAKTDREKVKRGMASGLSGPRQLLGRSLGGVSPRSIDWLWTGWIPKGYITIFAGETGAGKSTVLADIAARVTTGGAWPGEDARATRKAGRILWLGSEDSIEEMTVPRLMACGANLHNIVEIQGVEQQGTRNTFSMQDDLEAVSSWLASATAEGLPFAMLVIDPVTSYLPGQKLRKVDLNDAGQLRTVLEPWLILAQTHNIAIVCVTHFAKDTSRTMLHRVLGSAAFVQTCRSLCAVIERQGDNEPPHAKALIQVKVNLPEHPGGAWKLTTIKVEVAHDERNGKVIYATRPEWEELDNTLTPASIIGNARGPVSKYEAGFGLWLKAFFATRVGEDWLRVDLVKATMLAERVATERWWNDHSARYVEKRNEGGAWFCRPKGATETMECG